MSRKKRLVEKVFKVFCEGDTEHNYFEYIRRFEGQKVFQQGYLITINLYLENFT